MEQAETPPEDSGIRPTAADQTTDDAWWFGFTANKPGDLMPKCSKPLLAREEGEIYRSIDYMYCETIGLARQLKQLDNATALDAAPKLAGTPPRLGKPRGR